MKRNKHKNSGFFERILGLDDSDIDFDEDEEEENDEYEDEYEEEDEGDGDDEEKKEISTKETRELSIDLVEGKSSIKVTAPVPGIDLENLDITLTREVLTIETNIEDSFEERDGDYIYQEMYRGNLSRSVVLPEEVDVEAAEASIKNGILAIYLPKLDKKKKAKITIKKKG